MTTRTACFDCGGGARRRRSIRQVWQGRRLDGSARSLAVDLLGLQPARLQRFPDCRDLVGADHLRNGARHRARRFRRLTALMERGDAFIRPSHVRSNVTAADICPTTLRLGPQRRSLSPTLRRPRVARRGPGARPTTWPAFPLRPGVRSISRKQRPDRRSGAGSDPFRRLAQSPGCDIQMCVN